MTIVRVYKMVVPSILHMDVESIRFNIMVRLWFIIF